MFDITLPEIHDETQNSLSPIHSGRNSRVTGESMLFARRREGISSQLWFLGVLPARVSRPSVEQLKKIELRCAVTVDRWPLLPKHLPVVSITAISRDWRVSRPYVSRCVNHRGCPKSSLAAAREWRECYASKRPAVARPTDEQGDSNSSEDSTLIPLAAAREMAWRGYDAILDLVDELPKNVAAECNPSSPEVALAALKAECTYIVCNALDVYAAWSTGRSFFAFDRNPE